MGSQARHQLFLIAAACLVLGLAFAVSSCRLLLSHRPTSACDGAGSAVNTVVRYYLALDRREFRDAYACLTHTQQRLWPFDAWLHAYDHTVYTKLVFAHPVESAHASRIQVILAAEDRVATGFWRRTFLGTWQVTEAFRLTTPSILEESAADLTPSQALHFAQLDVIAYSQVRIGGMGGSDLYVTRSMRSPGFSSALSAFLYSSGRLVFVQPFLDDPVSLAGLILTTWTTGLRYQWTWTSDGFTLRSVTREHPRSWLKGSTLLTVYGRAFGVAPILGHLGMYSGFDEMAERINPLLQGMRAVDKRKRLVVAVHLIYGMATPCDQGAPCLSYLDDTGVDLVKQYIDPAAQRGWLVVLDDQIGRSTAAAEVQRIIDRGYLRYDNVEIALDPEFHTLPDQAIPGSPVGSLSGEDIWRAEQLIESYASSLHQPHRKVLIIHQFQSEMIVHREAIVSGLPWVDPVIVADGFGPPGLKAHVYHDLFGERRLRPGVLTGIKLFLPNPFERAGHADDPIMSWAQLIDGTPAVDPSDSQAYRLKPTPTVIIVA